MKKFFTFFWFYIIVTGLFFNQNAVAQTTYFTDGFETGLTQWLVSGQDWARTTATKRAGSYSITDSPSGNYPANANTIITTASQIDLTTATNPVLTFWHKYNINNYESNYPHPSDYIYVEISKDNGFNWTELKKYNGYLNNWCYEQINLIGYKGSKIKIRFRLWSTGADQSDGWFVDDVSINEIPTTDIIQLPFTDGFETGLTQWLVSGQDWARITLDKRSGSYSITDSPSGDYPANANTIITTASQIDLTTATNPLLAFWHKYNINNYESNYPHPSDYIYVEISKDNGFNWTELKKYNGIINNWTFEQIDLKSYKGSKIKIRFRLWSTGADQSAGWYIDDIEIKADINVILTSPNGGEILPIGTAQEIKWTASQVANVKLEYSTDNGTAWQTIIESTPASTGIYAWTVPNTPSSQCLVRVSDVTNPTTTRDVSNSTFSIANIQLAMTSPNGGENWKAGSTQNIAWTSSNVTNVKIEYTTNNGTIWSVISQSRPANPGSYAWTVPNINSTNCKVRITDVANSSVSDLSDSIFTIYKPELALSSPNGGQSWQIGSTQNITWTSSNITNVKLEYTTNNGTNWIVISSSTPASAKSYAWVIPNTPSSSCKVRISDVENALLNDISTNAFSIYTPGLTLISPNGGDVFFKGKTHRITWNSNNIANIKIEYSTDNGTSWTVIVSNATASSGSYAWFVPAKISTNCKIRISDVTNSTLKDESDGVFSISNPFNVALGTNGSTASAVSVGYYDGITHYASLAIDGNNDSYWASNWSMPAWLQVVFNKTYKIYSVGFYPPSIQHTYSISLSTDGTSWKVVVPARVSVASTYEYLQIEPTDAKYIKINITSTTAPSSWIFQSMVNELEAFSMNSSQLTLLSPNGGENWISGESKSITWSSTNIEKIKLEYSTDNGTNWIVINSNINAAAGSYTWVIPTLSSVNCKIRISDTANSTINDISDNVFTISQSSSQNLTLLKPNGGEIWAIGSVQKITWESNSIIALKLEYSTNNGSTWSSIISSTSAGTEYFNWTVPSTPSTNCKVKISDVTNNLISDISNNVFTINQSTTKSLVLSSPVGGEKLLAGSTHTITWGANNISRIKIEYSSNNGTSWNIIASSVDANLFTYDWTIPNLVSTNCKVRISDINDITYTSLSPSVFSIKTYPSSITLETSISFGGVDNQSYYKLIGLPGETNFSISNILTGAHKTDWTAYWDNGNSSKYQIEYDSSITFNFKPGNAFWILSKNQINISKTVNTVALSADKSYSIPLRAGWNLISNPFENNVPWSTILAKNNITQPIWSFDSNYNESELLIPYKGFYFYNSTNISSIKIPYLSNYSLEKSIDNSENNLKIALMKDFEKIDEVRIGFNQLSNVELDEYDIYSPGDLFVNSALNIIHPSGKERENILKGDFRDALNEGQEYILQVKNANLENLSLSFSGDSFEKPIYLVDDELKKITEVHQKIALNSISRNKRFRIIVGKEDYIKNLIQEYLPTELKLYQNYPNPFNPSTVIRFSLPEAGNFNLTVYNTLGQLITKLVDNQFAEAGYHEVIFNAQHFSSGIYIVQINFGNKTDNIKTLLIK